MHTAPIRTVEALDDVLSEPSPLAVETLGRLEGDVMLLGVGGKMGPTLARMAVRASRMAGVRRRVLGVARFSGGDQLKDLLEAHGVETIRCDLIEQAQLDRLPEVPNIIAMTGMKFGSTGQEALTWAMNAYLPGMIAQKFRRSRLVTFSSGNVYGLTPVHLGGCRESEPLNPVGEYGLSCVGRERIYEHFSRTLGIPSAILRLNYATELRYGVLHDVARRVWQGVPIHLDMGHLNALWQADANAMALCAFAHLSTPPLVLNLAGPETLSVRRVAEEFGALFDKQPTFEGSEAPDALLNNAQRAFHLFGYPRVSVQQMIHWIADWVRHGGPSLDKPTHFEVRDGRF